MKNKKYRLTALELQTLNIPSVMICDTMVGSLFQHHKIHAVGRCPDLVRSLLIKYINSKLICSKFAVVGADRIAKNGDTANKVCSFVFPNVFQPHLCTIQIGTYNAAVLAARHKIPFMVVAPISTVDLDIEDGSKCVSPIPCTFHATHLIHCLSA